MLRPLIVIRRYAIDATRLHQTTFSSFRAYLTASVPHRIEDGRSWSSPLFVTRILDNNQIPRTYVGGLKRKSR